MIVKLVIDLTMFHFASRSQNTILYYNLNIILRYLLLSGMLFYSFQSEIFKKPLMIVGGLFVFFSVWDILHVNPVLSDLHNHAMVLYANTLESVLMIFWILMYFYETVQSMRTANILTFPFFWICSGLLLYYSANVFVAPVMHYANKWEGRFELGFLYQVPDLFEIICMLFVSLGAWFFSLHEHGQY
ncbi:multisubunit Na+/H+ antiporter MnhG subunit [Rhabdobacter roseus]|uniref:Multisubunit Na+/H+ antiporter MnhG subunit n=1 Tax=Rhabdobacter roseus TaxID=1655419 RepID=A0A840TWZ1_9BACT|nr:hypothetical protein [Rhabdobacter roseus]MBB5285783.1 multisubunit Na+/H+ antiporter MnhG subunit [Rhabdobacter roseus]